MFETGRVYFGVLQIVKTIKGDNKHHKDLNQLLLLYYCLHSTIMLLSCFVIFILFIHGIISKSI